MLLEQSIQIPQSTAFFLCGLLESIICVLPTEMWATICVLGPRNTWIYSDISGYYIDTFIPTQEQPLQGARTDLLQQCQYLNVVYHPKMYQQMSSKHSIFQAFVIQSMMQQENSLAELTCTSNSIYGNARFSPRKSVMSCSWMLLTRLTRRIFFLGRWHRCKKTSSHWSVRNHSMRTDL